jgi:hypothetical protein
VSGGGNAKEVGHSLGGELFEVAVYSQPSGSQTFSKKFEKPLDKPPIICYNVNVIKGNTP